MLNHGLRHYKPCGNMRNLLPVGVNILALTATTTVETLNMKDRPSLLYLSLISLSSSYDIISYHVK